MPFMNVDLGFIYKKPTVGFDFFAFLLPFSTTVWVVIAASLVLTSISLYVFSKVYRREGDPLENITACFYFGIACLFAQGPETYPRTTFSRATAISWWFFSLMAITLYTASLTSMLTVNKTGLSIKSIEDLLNYNQYYFGTRPNGIVQRLFENSEYAPFQKMWASMDNNRENTLYNEVAGLQKVRDTDDFAFIQESPYLHYEATFAPCNLEVVVSPNSPKTGTGLAFGFPIDSELTNDFSVEFLNMFANGKMAAIHSKWFKTSSECSLEKEMTKTHDPIDFEKIKGIFYTFLFGMVLSFVFFVLKVTQNFVSDKLAERKARAAKRQKSTAGNDPPTVESTDLSNGVEKRADLNAASDVEDYNNHQSGELFQVKQRGSHLTPVYTN